MLYPHLSIILKRSEDEWRNSRPTLMYSAVDFLSFLNKFYCIQVASILKIIIYLMVESKYLNLVERVLLIEVLQLNPVSF
jgi:hypothetical protein